MASSSEKIDSVIIETLTLQNPHQIKIIGVTRDRHLRETKYSVTEKVQEVTFSEKFHPEIITFVDGTKIECGTFTHGIAMVLALAAPHIVLLPSDHGGVYVFMGDGCTVRHIIPSQIDEVVYPHNSMTVRYTVQQTKKHLNLGSCTLAQKLFFMLIDVTDSEEFVS